MDDVPKYSPEWFRLKEEEIAPQNQIETEDENPSADDESKEVGAATLNNEEPIAGSIESQTDENDVEPLPLATEEMDVEDNVVAHEPAVNMIETMRTDVAAPLPAAGLDVMKKNDPETMKKNTHKKKSQIEQLATGPSPLPASSHQDNVDMKMKAAANQQLSISNTREAISNSTLAAYNQQPSLMNTREDISNVNEAANGDLQTNEASDAAETSNRLNGTDRRNEIPQSLVIEDQRQTFVSSLGDTRVTQSESNALHASVSVIPQAFLVEDNKEVAMAELVPPWWKQKRVYVCLVVLVLVCTGVAVGTTQYVRNNRQVLLVNVTAMPSISLAPSSSQMPSLQPSACAERSSMDAEMLEFIFFNLTQPLTVMNGGHAVIADIHLENGCAVMYVVFYELRSWGWMKTQNFQECVSVGNDTDLDAGSWAYQSDSFWDGEYSLAMSKDTVLVGTPFVFNGTGDVLLFEYDHRIKQWSRNWGSMLIEYIFGREGKRLGQSVDVDNDLAVISAPGDNELYIYLRLESGWSQMTSIKMTNITNVAVSQDTIALTVGCQLHLYSYDREANSVEILQQFLEEFCSAPGDSYGDNLGSVALSENHLAVSVFNEFAYDFSDNGCYNPYLRAVSSLPIYNILLYHRLDDSVNYEFIQMLNSSDFEPGFGPNIDLDSDFLLAGSVGNTTLSFTFGSKVWDESVVLDTPDQCGLGGGGDTVVISKRNAVVSTYRDVYMYNVDGCEPMPTTVPSEPPSSHPTITCFQVELSVEHYHANKPAWLFERMNETTDELVGTDTMSSTIPTLRPTFGAFAVVGYDPYHLTYSNDRKCLQEGTHTFTIYNDPLSYNLTSNGNLIAEGREPGYRESTTFQIPFQ